MQIRSKELSIQIDKKLAARQRRLIKALPYLRKLVLEQIEKDTEPYIPYSTGKLASSVQYTPGYSGIRYTASYSKYAFCPNTSAGSPKQYNRTVHKKATGYPLKVSRNANIHKWRRFAERKWKEIAKNPERYYTGSN